MKKHVFVLLIVLLVAVPAVSGSLIWDSGHHEYSEGDETVAHLNNDATLLMVGGRIQYLTAHHISYVLVEGGAIENFQLENSAWAEIKDGTSQGEIWTDDASLISIEGGQLHWIKSYDSSAVIIKGGELEAVFAEGESTVEIRGGIISERLVATEASVIDIFGYGFSYDSQSGKWDDGQLKGFWGNEIPFTIDLQDWDDEGTFGHINLHIVPEPVSLVLFLLGGITVLRSKRQCYSR